MALGRGDRRGKVRWAWRVRARTGCGRARPASSCFDHRAKCHASEHCPPPAHPAPPRRRPPPPFSLPPHPFRDTRQSPRVLGSKDEAFFKHFSLTLSGGEAKPACPAGRARLGAVLACGVQAGGRIPLRERQYRRFLRIFFFFFFLHGAVSLYLGAYLIPKPGATRLVTRLLCWNLCVRVRGSVRWSRRAHRTF